MRTEVHQHPDGLVFVRTPDVTYADTPANVVLDFGITLPALPAGVDDRIYAPGVRHALMNSDTGVVGGGPMPWDVGDALIANVVQAFAKQKVRIEAAAASRPTGPPGPNISDIIAVLSPTQQQAITAAVAARGRKAGP